MKIRPILFSTPMVQSISENRKTQTRRTQGLEIINEEPERYMISKDGDIFNVDDLDTLQEFELSPKVKAGDILWVRETFGIDFFLSSMGTQYCYRANKLDSKPPDGWKPSRFMPKAACRLFLEVTNVRVERLQDISEEEAKSEGIYAKPGSVSGRVWYRKFIKAREARIDGLFTESAKECFQSLWQSINGKESWEANPFVFVYDFKIVDRPNNFLNNN